MITFFSLIFVIFFRLKEILFGSFFWLGMHINFFLIVLSLFCCQIGVSFLFSGRRKTDFYTLKILLVFSVLFINLSFLVSNVFVFLLFFELRLIPIMLLMFNFSKDEDKISSIVFMLFFNLSGSIPFILYSLRRLKLNLNFIILDSLFFESGIIFSSFILIFLTKIPIIFFHFWLPKAHGRASGICSIILASLVLKLGTFGLLKFSPQIIKISFLIACSPFSIGVLSSILFSLIMYRFFDLKHTVACSSILHICIVTPAIILNKRITVFSSVLIIVGHGLVSFILFYLVTILYESFYSRRSSISKTRENICKTFSIIIFLLLFFNLRIPPFINFLREIIFCSIRFSFSFLSIIFYLISLVLNIFFTFLLARYSVQGKKNLKAPTKVLSIDLFYLKTFVSTLLISPLIFYFFSL